MKFYALIAAMLLSGSIAFAHTDPIVMIIDGQSVKKSEFEYFYQKNHLGNTVDSKSVKVFTDGFVDYKLKVQAAKDAHLDTLPNIRRVLKRYDDIESCELMPDKGSVHVAHILLRLGQKASYQEQEVVERRIDSIYQALCKGADFADLAKIDYLLAETRGGHYLDEIRFLNLSLSSVERQGEFLGIFWHNYFRAEDYHHH